jgi:hypothetical protein
MYAHRNTHELTWTSPDAKTRNQIDHILIGDGIQVFFISDVSEEQTLMPILSSGGRRDWQ